jgi:hypothetical protein
LSATASLKPTSSNMKHGCTEEKPKANPKDRFER